MSSSLSFNPNGHHQLNTNIILSNGCSANTATTLPASAATQAATTSFSSKLTNPKASKLTADYKQIILELSMWPFFVCLFEWLLWNFNHEYFVSLFKELKILTSYDSLPIVPHLNYVSFKKSLTVSSCVYLHIFRMNSILISFVSSASNRLVECDWNISWQQSTHTRSTKRNRIKQTRGMHPEHVCRVEQTPSVQSTHQCGESNSIVDRVASQFVWQESTRQN